MTLPNEGVIDVARLSRIYDNTTATYKFYWFVSIINHLVANQNRHAFSFYEIIAGMIAEAWYTIHYFRISFGKLDSLEVNVYKLQELLNIPIDADKERVRNTILQNLENSHVKTCLQVFTLNVPYRFLSPWIPSANNPQVERASLNYMNNCPYAISGKTILIDKLWADYIIRNAVILKDYSYWNLSIFLQKRNPNVPDIPSKLIKPVLRSPLTKQRRFWDRYIESEGNIKCIYTHHKLSVGNYDLDHFIPWSFVVHDLIWNLLPVDSSINSSKNNCIPSLDRYLTPLADIQQKALRCNYEKDSSDKLLEDYLVFRCSIQELVEASQENFTEILNREFTPMTQTAINMGFAPWSNIPEYEK